MSGLAWKIPLVLVLALLIAATTLATRARIQAGQPPALAPVSQPPIDGLAQAKREAAHAAELETLRTAIRDFNTNEGRPPADLEELVGSRYLDYIRVKPDLRAFRYDPATMHLARIGR